jgi:hypothetical protein
LQIKLLVCKKYVKYGGEVFPDGIHSEQCIGFLKGHWPSLRGLHVRINNKKTLQYATLGLQHAFTSICLQ